LDASFTGTQKSGQSEQRRAKERSALNWIEALAIVGWTQAAFNNKSVLYRELEPRMESRLHFARQIGKNGKAASRGEQSPTPMRRQNEF
jgi:hypothetical protein